VRRRFIHDKYDVLVDAMYGGRSEQYIETMVKFEDGRTGTISATLKVNEARVHAPMKARREADAMSPRVLIAVVCLVAG